MMKYVCQINTCLEIVENELKQCGEYLNFLVEVPLMICIYAIQCLKILNPPIRNDLVITLMTTCR